MRNKKGERGQMGRRFQRLPNFAKISRFSKLNRKMASKLPQEVRQLYSDLDELRQRHPVHPVRKEELEGALVDDSKIPKTEQMRTKVLRETEQLREGTVGCTYFLERFK